MTPDQVLANYESLSVLTYQMRDAAEKGEWEQLIALEQQCSRQVATMKPIDASIELDEPSKQIKIQLIKRILANDAEIRSRTQSWMSQLQRILQSTHQEQRLQRAYGG